MAWLVASLRRLRHAPIQTGLLALLIGVTAFVFAVAPRLLQTTADSVLRADLATTPVDVRGLEIVQYDRFVAGTADPFSITRQNGAAYEAQFPPSVNALVASTDVVVESPRWRLASAALEDRTLRLRFQPAAEAHIHVVDGAFPSGATRVIPASAAPDTTFPSGPVTVVQAALSVASAAALGAHVGDTIVLTLDPTDPQTERRQLVMAIDVVGIYAVSDPNDPYWFADPALDHPTIRSLSALAQIQDVTALLAPAAYEPLLEATASEPLLMRYRWRFPVDAERLSDAGVDTVIADLRRLEGLFPPDTGAVTDAPVLQSGLRQLLSLHEAGWQAADVVLTVVANGPAVVAAAALALVAALTGRGRRQSLSLARARGASRSQIWLSLFTEGLLVAVPPVVLAAILAAAAVPDGPTSQTAVAAAGVGGVAVLLLMGTTLRGLAGGARGREGKAGLTTSPRRLTLEALAVLLAVGGAALLLERGVRGASSTGDLATADPFIAVVPALVGLAAGLVLRRLYPFVMRAAAGIAGARRDLVPVLAMRRAVRAGSGDAILLVLLAAVALGSFASAVLVDLDRSADAIAWQQVGAPYSLTDPSGPFPPGFAPAQLPGVSAAAAVYLGPASIVDHAARVQLVALDPPAYQAVVANTPADQGLPAALHGAPSGPQPVIVSTDLAGGAAGLSVGDRISLAVSGVDVPVQVALERDSFPTLAARSSFIVISRPQLEAALSGTQLPTRIWFLTAPPEAAPALRATLAAQAPGVALTSLAETTAALSQRPIVQGVAGGIISAALVAAAYAALAVIAALILTGAARAAEVARLRLLGLTRRQVLGLVVAEHGPTVLASFAAGTGLGLSLFLLLRPGLGLGAVVGSDVTVSLGVEPAHLALVLSIVVGIVAVGIVAGAVTQRHATPVAAVRGDLE
jgi:putative ABC transport system permease protein